MLVLPVQGAEYGLPLCVGKFVGVVRCHLLHDFIELGLVSCMQLCGFKIVDLTRLTNRSFSGLNRRGRRRRVIRVWCRRPLIWLFRDCHPPRGRGIAMIGGRGRLHRLLVPTIILVLLPFLHSSRPRRPSSIVLRIRGTLPRIWGTTTRGRLRIFHVWRRMTIVLIICLMLLTPWRVVCIELAKVRGMMRRHVLGANDCLHVQVPVVKPKRLSGHDAQDDCIFGRIRATPEVRRPLGRVLGAIAGHVSYAGAAAQWERKQAQSFQRLWQLARMHITQIESSLPSYRNIVKLK